MIIRNFAPSECVEMADFIQAVIQVGVPAELRCPLHGSRDKAKTHARFCQVCRMRELLTPGWGLPEERAE